jgi:hypothetical protein
LNTLDVNQRTEEWFHARIGSVTASAVAAVVTKMKKGGYYAERRNYQLKMVAEILRGDVLDNYVSPAMQYGIDNEPLARAAYEMECEEEVEHIGLVFHPTISRAAASPDGLVGTKGMVQFKVPNSDTHIDYILGGVVPELYRPQMYWEMACAEREWNDFVSHDPRLPDKHLSTFIVRLERDDKIIADMETEVRIFLAEVDEMLAKIKERIGGQPITEFKLRQSIAQVQFRKQQKQEQEEADRREMGEEIVL